MSSSLTNTYFSETGLFCILFICPSVCFAVCIFVRFNIRSSCLLRLYDFLSVCSCFCLVCVFWWRCLSIHQTVHLFVPDFTGFSWFISVSASVSCFPLGMTVGPTILSVCLSVYPSVFVYLSVCLSVRIWFSVCLSICLFVCLCMSVRLSVLSVFLSVYLSVCLSVHVCPTLCSVCLSVYLSVCLSVHVCPSLCSVCLSPILTVFLFVCFCSYESTATIIYCLSIPVQQSVLTSFTAFFISSIAFSLTVSSSLKALTMSCETQADDKQQL